MSLPKKLVTPCKKSVVETIFTVFCPKSLVLLVLMENKSKEWIEENELKIRDTFDLFDKGNIFLKLPPIRRVSFAYISTDLTTFYSTVHQIKHLLF
jgi:hypothetical protein